MSHPYNAEQTERFWCNVDVGNRQDCWTWLRGKTSHGYGQVSINVGLRKRVMKAHRVAWEIRNNQAIPEGHRCLHSCDNMACCNPGHVYLLGVKQPKQKKSPAKLTERQASLIKHKLTDLSTREISEAFGVSYNTIWDIRNGQTWRHI